MPNMVEKRDAAGSIKRLRMRNVHLIFYARVSRKLNRGNVTNSVAYIAIFLSAYTAATMSS